MSDVHVPDRIKDRACELWVRALRDPTYDTLGETRKDPRADPTGGVALCERLATASRIASTKEVLERFRVALRAAMVDGDHEQNWRYMSVDYGPDAVLRKAGEAAGLRTAFPWKTTVCIETGNVAHVAFSMGYGARTIRHYPLSGDRWLVVDLFGGDIDKVILSAENGNPLGFTIDGGA